MIQNEIKIVQDIPKLGSGKKDFNASKILAKVKFDLSQKKSHFTSHLLDKIFQFRKLLQLDAK